LKEKCCIYVLLLYLRAITSIVLEGQARERELRGTTKYFGGMTRNDENDGK